MIGDSSTAQILSTDRMDHSLETAAEVMPNIVKEDSDTCEALSNVGIIIHEGKHDTEGKNEESSSQSSASTEVIGTPDDYDEEVEELYRIAKPSYSDLHFLGGPTYGLPLSPMGRYGHLAHPRPTSACEEWSDGGRNPMEASENNPQYLPLYTSSPQTYSQRLPSWAAPSKAEDPFVPMVPFGGFPTHLIAESPQRKTAETHYKSENEGSLRDLLGHFSFCPPPLNESTFLAKSMSDDPLSTLRDAYKTIPSPWLEEDSGNDNDADQSEQRRPTCLRL